MVEIPALLWYFLLAIAIAAVLSGLFLDRFTAWRSQRQYDYGQRQREAEAMVDQTLEVAKRAMSRGKRERGQHVPGWRDW